MGFLDTRTRTEETQREVCEQLVMAGTEKGRRGVWELG